MASHDQVLAGIRGTVAQSVRLILGFRHAVHVLLTTVRARDPHQQVSGSARIGFFANDPRPGNIVALSHGDSHSDGRPWLLPVARLWLMLVHCGTDGLDGQLVCLGGSREVDPVPEFPASVTIRT
jgi:hypothetical protein